MFRGVPHFDRLLIMSALFLLVFSYSAGVERARRKTDYLVPASDPSFVVLRDYGARYVLTKLAQDGKSVTREFRLVVPASPSVAESESFHLKQIGPLIPPQ